MAISLLWKKHGFDAAKRCIKWPLYYTSLSRTTDGNHNKSYDSNMNFIYEFQFKMVKKYIGRKKKIRILAFYCIFWNSFFGIYWYILKYSTCQIIAQCVYVTIHCHINNMSVITFIWVLQVVLVISYSDRSGICCVHLKFWHIVHSEMLFSGRITEIS